MEAKTITITTTTTTGSVTLPPFHAFEEGMSITTDMVLIYDEGDGYYAIAFPRDCPDYAICWEGIYIFAHSGRGSREEFPDALPIGWWPAHEFPLFAMLSGKPDSEGEYTNYVLAQK